MDWASLEWWPAVAGASAPRPGVHLAEQPEKQHKEPLGVREPEAWLLPQDHGEPAGHSQGLVATTSLVPSNSVQLPVVVPIPPNYN